MTNESLSKHYMVLNEGREILNGHIVLPGAVRMPAGQDSVPVTTNYKHELVIGEANGFTRTKVGEGSCNVICNVSLRADCLLTHDDLRKLKAGVFLSNIFAYKQPGEHEMWITDGLIREISFYDPTPPAVKFMEG